MDLDGDVDLLSASSFDDTVARRGVCEPIASANFDHNSWTQAWYDQTGPRSFTKHEITTLAEKPRKVWAADMDGDGDVVRPRRGNRPEARAAVPRRASRKHHRNRALTQRESPRGEGGRSPTRVGGAPP